MKSLPPEIIEFLEQHMLAIIATSPPPSGKREVSVLKSIVSFKLPTYGKDVYPHVTCVFYATDEIGNLYFASHLDSNRLKHIKDNSHIGLAITDQEKLLTLRLEGIATLMNMDEKVKEVGKKIAEIASSESYPSLPPFMKIEGEPMQIIKISIKHYFFSKFSKNRPVITQGTINQ